MAGNEGWTDRRMEILSEQPSALWCSLSAARSMFGGDSLSRASWAHTRRLPCVPWRTCRFSRRRRHRARGVSLRREWHYPARTAVVIATPVARVAFSIFGFAEEHDKHVRGNHGRSCYWFCLQPDGLSGVVTRAGVNTLATDAENRPPTVLLVSLVLHRRPNKRSRDEEPASSNSQVRTQFLLRSESDS